MRLAFLQNGDETNYGSSTLMIPLWPVYVPKTKEKRWDTQKKRVYDWSSPYDYSTEFDGLFLLKIQSEVLGENLKKKNFKISPPPPKYIM